MTFDTLDTYVFKALSLLERGVPTLPDISFQRPLVVGSGNALETGKILFRDRAAVFATESLFESVLDRYRPDGVVLISASGGKHATGIARAALKRGARTVLLTHTSQSPAGVLLPPADVTVFPKNVEPYTYNTSTYLSLIAATERPNSSAVSAAVTAALSQCDTALQAAHAYTFVVPTAYALAVPMFDTKGRELFGSMLMVRAFAEEDLKHAKTVVRNPDELYIVLGSATTDILYADSPTLLVPLPANSYLTALAIGYALIGRIQAAHPSYFAQNIEQYCTRASAVFDQKISPMVD